MSQPFPPGRPQPPFHPNGPGPQFGPNQPIPGPPMGSYGPNQFNAPPPKKQFYQRWWFWGIAAFVAIGAIGSGTDSHDSATVAGSARPSTVATSSQPTTPAPSQASAPTTQAAPRTTEAAAPRTTQAPAPAATRSKDAAVGLNTAVVDDDLEFTVTSYKCGVTVSDGFSKVTPQGKFCQLKVTAKNVGTKQTTISDDQIKLVDANGAEYQTSSDTWLTEGKLLYEKINPGNTIRGNVYIDVPEDVTPVQVILKGGYFSRGTKVSLTST